MNAVEQTTTEAIEAVREFEKATTQLTLAINCGTAITRKYVAQKAAAKWLLTLLLGRRPTAEEIDVVTGGNMV